MKFGSVEYTKHDGISKVEFHVFPSFVCMLFLVFLSFSKKVLYKGKGGMKGGNPIIGSGYIPRESGVFRVLGCGPVFKKKGEWFVDALLWFLRENSTRGKRSFQFFCSRVV